MVYKIKKYYLTNTLDYKVRNKIKRTYFNLIKQDLPPDTNLYDVNLFTNKVSVRDIVQFMTIIKDELVIGYGVFTLKISRDIKSDDRLRNEITAKVSDYLVSMVNEIDKIEKELLTKYKQMDVREELEGYIKDIVEKVVPKACLGLIEMLENSNNVVVLADIKRTSDKIIQNEI